MNSYSSLSFESGAKVCVHRQVALIILWKFSHSASSLELIGSNNMAMRPATSIDMQVEDASAVRTDLKDLLRRILLADGVSQSRAARLCSTDQPRISKLLSGRSDSVSTEQLLKWLTHLGYDVQIVVRRAATPVTGSIKVVSDV